MKLIIAGSRNIKITRYQIEHYISDFELNPTQIVSGGCPTGPDNAAFWFCKNESFPYKEYPADWNKHGKSAGPKRNEQMARYGDALLLIWDGCSKGSLNMKNNMEKLGKPIYEVILKKTNIQLTLTSV